MNTLIELVDKLVEAVHAEFYGRTGKTEARAALIQAIEALQDRIESNNALCIKRVAEVTRERDTLRAEVEHLKSVANGYKEGYDARGEELATLKGAEPVAYEFRMRADWIADWGLWSPCNKEQHENYLRVPKLHDWHYETRALYAGAAPQAPAPTNMTKVLIDRELLERIESAFNSGLSIPSNTQLRTALRAALAAPQAPAPTKTKFTCWQIPDTDSWYEHPADAQIIHDLFGEDPKVGDEYELSASIFARTVRYRITSVSEDGDCEVEAAHGITGEAQS
jgi:hypothetical protein